MKKTTAIMRCLSLILTLVLMAGVSAMAEPSTYDMIYSASNPIPEIAANHAEAQIVHEAAIGRINNDQLVKLMSFGMDEQEAEEVIIQGFLR